MVAEEAETPAETSAQLAVSEPRKQGHRFQPGQSGNPRGRPKGSLNLSTILREEVKPKDKRAMARAAVEAAKSGNVKALEFYRDTTEGKPVQMVRVSHDRPSWIAELLGEELNDSQAQLPPAAQDTGEVSSPPRPPEFSAADWRELADE